MSSVIVSGSTDNWFAAASFAAASSSGCCCKIEMIRSGDSAACAAGVEGALAVVLSSLLDCELVSWAGNDVHKNDTDRETAAPLQAAQRQRLRHQWKPRLRAI